MGSGASIIMEVRDESSSRRGPSAAYMTSLKNAQEGKSDRNVDMRYAIAPLRNSGTFVTNSSKGGSRSVDTIHDGHLTSNKHILNVPGEGLIVHRSMRMSLDDYNADDDLMSTSTGSQFMFLPSGNSSIETTRGQFVCPADTNPQKGDVLYFVGAQDTS